MTSSKKPERFYSPLIRTWQFCWLAVVLALTTPDAPAFENFITAQGGRLFDGTTPYRFISFNIPNLTYTEDDLRFTQTNPFRLPTKFEIDDALETISQMGGRVARTYVLSVAKTNDLPDTPRHILAPGQLNEAAMVVLDEVLASANRHNVRLIIPFVDYASWWGGITELAAWRGKTKAEFFTDPEVRADYQKLVSLVVNRTNTQTGLRYKDDKAVLAWELGNELQAPVAWVREMAAHVKHQAPRQLVAESYFTANDNPNVDLVQDHLYQGDPEKMIAQIRTSAKSAAGKKVYLVGEFGFVSTEAMRAIMDTIIAEPNVAGGLIWSLRYHNQDGGYYWHHEPWGGDFFKAYHWPGGPAGAAYDEPRFMKLVRTKAFEIQNQPVPPLAVPTAPDLFSVSPEGIVNWRGAVGAATYSLQRATNSAGPWQTTAWQLTDDATSYHPLASDEFAQLGTAYFYRLRAENETGTSKPSNVFGPINLRCHTMVDEFRNTFLIYRQAGKIELRTNEARNYKEDCHRLHGEPETWLAYRITGKIKTVRVFAFDGSGPASLNFFAGSDGATGQKLEPNSQTFYAGTELYNYQAPRLYTLQVDAATGELSELSIAFTRATQLSRVEIEYQ